MTSSDKLIEMIKEFEGFSAKPYLCPAGVATIGYGTTVYDNGIKVKMSDKPITESEAVKLIRSQLVSYENAVNRYVQIPLSQNQFDALVDFAYNLGIGALKSSTLLKKINDGNIIGASEEFGKWVYANGKKLKGLVRRREAEKELFCLY